MEKQGTKIARIILTKKNFGGLKLPNIGGLLKGTLFKALSPCSKTSEKCIFMTAETVMHLSPFLLKTSQKGW